MAQIAETGSGRATSKRRQHEVVAAAVKMFYESGYSETSVEDIANELGILKGSLYYYITSKEDLLYAIVREVHTEVEELLASSMSDASHRTARSPIQLRQRTGRVQRAQHAEDLGLLRRP